MNTQLIIKLIAIAVSVSFLLLSTGCMSRRELNTLGIIGIVGVDVEGEKIKVTVQSIKPHPAKGEGSKEQQVLIQVTGDSIYDAIRNATLKTSRKLFWSHTVAYLFSEEAARMGLDNFIDFATRNIETRRSVFIFIIKGAAPEEIIGIRGDKIEKNQSDYIQKLVRQQKENAKSVSVNVKDFMNMYYDKGIQPISGVLSVHKITIDGSSENGKTKRSDLSVEGAALFRNGKLIGFLNGKETRALNFVKNKVKSGSIALQNSGHTGITVIEILDASSKSDVRLSNGKAMIRLKVKLSGNITEETKAIDLRKPAAIKNIEQTNSSYVKREIEHVIKKTQEQHKTDIFGFGQSLHRNDPHAWKSVQDHWDEIFANANVNVEVTTTIKRYGMTDIPADMDWKKFKFGGGDAPHAND